MIELSFGVTSSLSFTLTIISYLNLFFLQIGLDGTGKEQCLTLACQVSDCHLYKLSVPWNCCQFDFRDNLRKAFRQAGVHRRNTVLYITDADLAQVCLRGFSRVETVKAKRPYALGILVISPLSLSLSYIYMYSFRHFYPKRLPRESFTKVHRSLIITYIVKN